MTAGLRFFVIITLWAIVAMPDYCLGSSDSLLSDGAGSFVFSNSGKNIKVWYYNPGIRPKTRVVFVLHGVKRNGREYRDSWAEYARTGDFLLLVPEFDKISYPGQQYSQGNILSKNGQPIHAENWAFAVIESIFDYIKTDTRLVAEKYNLYGHSAGAQFVHRFVLFLPDARLEKAVAANAGWYTMPVFQTAFPYGVLDTNLNSMLLGRAFSKNLIVMLGSADTDSNHKFLNKSPQAILQGRNRLERGQNFFNSARATAVKLGTQFNWKLIIVDGAGHSNSKMSKEAVKLLIN